MSTSRVTTGSLCVAVALLVLAVPIRAQAPLGGCANGEEQGFAKVLVASELVAWRSGEVFVEALPGDELRLCRIEGASAVVTLWSRGWGYTLPGANLGSPNPKPTLRDLSPTEAACLAGEVNRVQGSFRSEGQGREFLLVARKWGVTLGQVEQVRGDIFDGRVTPADLATCRPGGV